MAKISGRVTDLERAICARVKEFRKRIRWPQPAFAQEIGITRDKLASIEGARTPLSYGVAVEVCQVFNVSGEWLATGNGEINGGSPVLWVVEFELTSNKTRLFSDVYAQWPELFANMESYTSPLRERATPGFDAKAYLFRRLTHLLNTTKFRTSLEVEWFARDVTEHAKRFIDAIVSSGHASQTRMSKLLIDYEGHVKLSEKATGLKTLQSASQATLDTESLSPYSAGMQELKSVPDLVVRIKKLSKQLGSKAALARKLGVSRQAVDQWLNGKTTPSTDVAIKVMNLE